MSASGPEEPVLEPETGEVEPGLTGVTEPHRTLLLRQLRPVMRVKRDFY